MRKLEVLAPVGIIGADTSEGFQGVGDLEVPEVLSDGGHHLSG